MRKKNNQDYQKRGRHYTREKYHPLANQYFYLLII